MAGAVFHSHITSNASEEIKLDGYRAVAANLKGKVSLASRKRKSFRGQYPYIIEALSDLPENTIVDGDIVALDDVGRPNFSLLQHSRSQLPGPAFWRDAISRLSEIPVFIRSDDELSSSEKDVQPITTSHLKSGCAENAIVNGFLHLTEQR